MILVFCGFLKNILVDYNGYIYNSGHFNFQNATSQRIDDPSFRCASHRSEARRIEVKRIASKRSASSHRNEALHFFYRSLVINQFA